MDFSFITQALSQIFAPDTAAYALATIGLAVHMLHPVRPARFWRPEAWRRAT